MSKSVSDSTQKVGESSTYTITLFNAGPNVFSSITVNARLWGYWSSDVSSSDLGTTYAGGVWTLPSLASGVTDTLTITGTVNSATANTNTATLTDRKSVV